MTIDVVVPSYRRPELLERCLTALVAQSSQPNRIIIVARRDDGATLTVVERWASRHVQVFGRTVDEPGVIAAMTAGVAVSTSDLIAFTDDDAEPRADWIARLVRHFSDPSVGGVGGRDVIIGEEGPLTPVVGRFTRYGKLVGNHHLGCGQARSVDVLKGVNMAFRAEALALPKPGVLRGSGAQAHFEVLVGGLARRRGWRLVYDPSILVDHEVGVRTGVDLRWRPEPSAVHDAAFNSSVAIGAVMRQRSGWPPLYGVLVGSRGEPSFGRAAVAIVRREREVARRAFPGITGHAHGFARAARRVQLDELMVTAAELRAGSGPYAVPTTICQSGGS